MESFTNPKRLGIRFLEGTEADAHIAEIARQCAQNAAERAAEKELGLPCAVCIAAAQRGVPTDPEGRSCQGRDTKPKPARTWK